MLKILVADDSRFQVQTLTSWFTRKGFEVITALDAMQAWTSALRANPDLLVLDINMPAGNGLEILRRLKAAAKTKHIPVIVITSDEKPATESSARSLGADEFFRKPLDQEQVCATVDRLLTPAAPKPEQALGHSSS